jgi:hypothetical protein
VDDDLEEDLPAGRIIAAILMPNKLIWSCEEATAYNCS